jgi:hypothetical protein
MNFNSVPNDQTDVVFRTREGYIFSGFFTEGYYYRVFGSNKTLVYCPKDIECWAYAENLFFADMKKKPAPAQIEHTQPDWEQRRYEIAKEVLAAMVGKMYTDEGPKPSEIRYDCGYAVSYADALIEMLKNVGQ